MKKCLAILLVFSNQFTTAQKIINSAMVGDNGITEDVKKAKFLIVIKTSADTAFERLEYNFTGPLKRRLTYKDPALKILHGDYTTFYPSGVTSGQGNYIDNKRDGKWYTYNDTAKIVYEYRYHQDTLLAVLNWDSLELARKKITIDTTVEHEAVYKGGDKKYINYIYRNLKIPDRTQVLEAGGTVKVRFIVNTEGKVTNVHVWKSVEFAFDEEVMRLISSAQDWIPASQRGRKVNAYREQPVTISFK